jgi:hypothetical protein
MSVWLSASMAAVALMAVSATSTVAAGEVLKICLDENLPPLSAHRRGAPDNGFDLALAREVAQRLGRPLEVQWFASKLDEDSSPALEANALLSDGRCSLVGSYALTRDSLVVPGIKTAKLPDFEGATGPDHRRRVPLGALAASEPYIYSPLTIVLGPRAHDRHISGVGDLAGLRVGIESGTLADAILMTFDNGRLIDDITHWSPAGAICSVRSNAANSTRHCSTCAGSTPIAPPILTPGLPAPDIFIRSASTVAMWDSPAIRLCSSK